MRIAMYLGIALEDGDVITLPPENPGDCRLSSQRHTTTSSVLNARAEWLLLSSSKPFSPYYEHSFTSRLMVC